MITLVTPKYEPGDIVYRYNGINGFIPSKITEKHLHIDKQFPPIYLYRFDGEVGLFPEFSLHLKGELIKLGHKIIEM